MSEFDAFESNPATDAADPAADFLAQEEAEMAKIENSDPFAAFESAENKTNATEIKDPFEMEELATETEVLDIKDTADEEKTNVRINSRIFKCVFYVCQKLKYFRVLNRMMCILRSDTQMC